MTYGSCYALSAAVALVALPAAAQDVRITPEMERFEIEIDGRAVEIGRIQDQENRLEGEFTKTSRACPPFCIHPMSAGDGVETVGELEVMDFIETHVAEGTGLLVDSRIPAWFEKGTIPGAVNLPFVVVEPDNAYRDEVLKAIGGRETDAGWDFSEAFDLLMFCNGPWCDQSPRAIANLLDVGYPAEKLRYYRGGMQVWQVLGLTVTKPEKAS